MHKRPGVDKSSHHDSTVQLDFLLGTVQFQVLSTPRSVESVYQVLRFRGFVVSTASLVLSPTKVMLVSPGIPFN